MLKKICCFFVQSIQKDTFVKLVNVFVNQVCVFLCLIFILSFFSQESLLTMDYADKTGNLKQEILKQETTVYKINLNMVLLFIFSRFIKLQLVCNIVLVKIYCLATSTSLCNTVLLTVSLTNLITGRLYLLTTFTPFPYLLTPTFQNFLSVQWFFGCTPQYAAS